MGLHIPVVVNLQVIKSGFKFSKVLHKFKGDEVREKALFIIRAIPYPPPPLPQTLGQACYNATFQIL